MKLGVASEMQLEDLMVDYITNWTSNIFLKVKFTQENPSTSTPINSPTQFGPPSIHAGLLPVDEVGQIQINRLPVYPFVLVHISNLLDKFDHVEDPLGSSIMTKVICGAWDDDPAVQGHRDCLGLSRVITRKFWRIQTIGHNFLLDIKEGVKTRLYDSNEVTWPFFICEASYCWKVRTIIAGYESEDLGLDLQEDDEFITQPTIPGVNPNPSETYQFE